MSAIDQGVREVMAAVFGVNPKHVDATASPATIKTWDSLQHLNLVLALEERFSTHFSIDEIAALNSYTSIVTLISQHLPHSEKV